MPLNEFECRQKLLKQNPPNFTVSRKKKDKRQIPGPADYELKELYGGQGYSHYRHAPAYSFGLRLPIYRPKPSVSDKAPQLNIRNTTRKGVGRITHCSMNMKSRSLTDITQIPGPDYLPPFDGKYKRSPAFTMPGRPKEHSESKTQWTAPPNMYWPPMSNKPKNPSYSIKGTSSVGKLSDQFILPTATTYNPKFDYVKRRRPEFSFGYRTPIIAPLSEVNPAPNTYCENKFDYNKKRSPAPSFGIKHSPYLGQPAPQLLPEKPCTYKTHY